MANYPTSLDSFTNPSSVDSLSAPSHSLQHADANDAIEALEAKVGIGTSTAGSATAGHVLVASTGGTTSWTTVGASAINTTGGTAGQYLSAGTAGVATWSTLPASGAETVLASGSFSAVSALNLSNVLSDTYVYYRFYIRGYVQTSAQTMYLKFRENTTDKSSGYYGGGFVGYFNGTSSVISHNNTSALGITSWFTNTATNGNAIITITRPSATNGLINVLAYDSPNSGGIFSGGENQSMTNFNGLTFYPNAQTMTGSYLLTGIK